MALPSLSSQGVQTTGWGQSTTNSASDAAGNYVGASAVISSLGSIATAYSTVEAFKAQIDADTKARIANMNNVMDSYEYTEYKLKEAYNSLDEQFADKVSERLLQSMKDVATARAMSAETGAISGDVEAGLEADKMFDLAVINSQRSRALAGIFAQKEEASMNAANQIKSLASSGYNVRANSLVSAMSGATSALGSLLTTMPNDVRAELFGFDTSGTKESIYNSK